MIILVKFIEETNTAGQGAVARAVVAYCDGQSVKTFVGETYGKLADQPKGRREFYWDTVFIPNETNCGANGKTYAEMIEDPDLGLLYKVDRLSQSFRAMRKCLEYLLKNPRSNLWP